VANISVPTQQTDYSKWVLTYGSERAALIAALARIESLNRDNKHLIDLCEEVLLALERAKGNGGALRIPKKEEKCTPSPSSVV